MNPSSSLREVRGGKAQLPPPLGTVHDFAPDGVRAPEKPRSGLDVAVREEFADPRGRHAAIALERADIADHVDVEAELTAQLLQNVGVARSPAAEPEVGADQDGPCAERIDQDALDELARREARQRLVESQQERRVDARLGEELQPSASRR